MKLTVFQAALMLLRIIALYILRHFVCHWKLKFLGILQCSELEFSQVAFSISSWRDLCLTVARTNLRKYMYCLQFLSLGQTITPASQKYIKRLLNRTFPVLNQKVSSKRFYTNHYNSNLVALIFVCVQYKTALLTFWWSCEPLLFEALCMPFFSSTHENCVYRRISVVCGRHMLSSPWPYLGSVTMCWIIIV